MATYPSNRGVGSPLVIMGLSGQYIVIAIAVLLILFVMAVILGSTPLPVLLTVMIVVILGILSVGGIIRMNRKFGIHGLMKLQANRALPDYLKYTKRINGLIKKAEA